jgi:cytochrome c oxidase subunit 4
MGPSREERLLYRVAAALLALLALTVGLSALPLGRLSFPAALTIAGAKALLVAYFFMELGQGVDAVRFFASAGLVWLALLLAGTLADLATRGGP